MSSVTRGRRLRRKLIAASERRRARDAHAVAIMTRLRWLVVELDNQIAEALAELDAGEDPRVGG